MGKWSQLWFGRRMNASRREAGSHSGRWAERETHRSLRAAGGGEPLSPDIHPIIIKLSLQGGAEGCLQRQPTRKQEGRRHQIHSCRHPPRHDGNIQHGRQKKKKYPSKFKDRARQWVNTNISEGMTWEGITNRIGVRLSGLFSSVLINPESCLVVVLTLMWMLREKKQGETRRKEQEPFCKFKTSLVQVFWVKKNIFVFF